MAYDPRPDLEAAPLKAVEHDELEHHRGMLDEQIGELNHRIDALDRERADLMDRIAEASRKRDGLAAAREAMEPHRRDDSRPQPRRVADHPQA